MTTPRVLVVEDEQHLAAGLKLNLELDGYHVDVAKTGREASYQLVSPTGYAVIILDIMLPDMNGFDLCARIRESGNFTPVLMLTARSDPDDRVRGLEAGADDYLAKPFDLDELLARVRSMLRRQQWLQADATTDSESLQIGEAHVDFSAYTVTVGGASLKLTQLEFDMLRYFASNAGRVVTRRELLEHVWKLANHPNTRTVDNFVARLRKHFEPNPAAPVHFLSVRGAGYKFVP